jgi:hypothetical protein
MWYNSYMQTEAQKAAKAAHYQANKEAYKARFAARKRLFSRIAVELKTFNPCMDCKNYFHPCAMQFDHRPGTNKLFHVSDYGKFSSVVKFLEEIDKCDLVCANCHAVRTYTRRVK